MAAIDAIAMDTRRILLEVLMHMAWADRQITPEEKQAAQAAAIALGLVLPGDRDITSNDRTPMALDDLDVGSLAPRDRELVYVCASWMSIADADEAEAERALLERLGDRLGLDDARRDALRERARALRERQISERSSWWRAFDRLVVEAARAIAG